MAAVTYNLDLAINVSLVILATVAAILAILGDTWDASQPSFFRRITGRGWGAAGCFLLMLALGVVKEVRAASDAGALQATAADAKEQLAVANGQLEALKEQLVEANRIAAREAAERANLRTRSLCRLYIVSDPDMGRVAEHVSSRLTAFGYKPVVVTGKEAAEWMQDLNRFQKPECAIRIRSSRRPVDTYIDGNDIAEIVEPAAGVRPHVYYGGGKELPEHVDVLFMIGNFDHELRTDRR